MALPLLEAPFAVGIALAWSLAAPPGPANAFIAHASARHGYWRGWWTGIGACVGDLVMFTLMAIGVAAIVGRFAIVQATLAAVGALLMAKFARDAWMAARDPAAGRPGGSFTRSFVVIVTSPFNWAWWLTAGTALFARLGWPVMVGFFVGLVGWVTFWSALARSGARLRRFAEWVGYASAGTLAVFAVVVAWFAARAFSVALA